MNKSNYCPELPTAAGSVIRWQFHWDTTNYRAAVLTYGQRWDEATDAVAYEGLMWHTTDGKALTPEEIVQLFTDARSGPTGWRNNNFVPVDMQANPNA